MRIILTTKESASPGNPSGKNITGDAADGVEVTQKPMLHRIQAKAHNTPKAMVARHFDFVPAPKSMDGKCWGSG